MAQSSGAVRTSSPVVSTILLLNLIVFGMWLTEALPLPFMVDNFLVSWRHLEQGRVWTLITSAFSHTLLFHILFNMIVLRSFGPALEQLLGSGRFLVFYLLAGIAGSLSHALVSNYLLDAPEQAALGASGALAGMLIVFSLTFPRATVLLFFVLPIPAFVGALIFVAIDVYGLMLQIQDGGWPIGHGAHLGGAVAGLLYVLVRGRALRGRKRELEAAVATAGPSAQNGYAASAGSEDRLPPGARPSWAHTSGEGGGAPMSENSDTGSNIWARIEQVNRRDERHEELLVYVTSADPAPFGGGRPAHEPGTILAVRVMLEGDKRPAPGDSFRGRVRQERRGLYVAEPGEWTVEPAPHEY